MQNPQPQGNAPDLALVTGLKSGDQGAMAQLSRPYQIGLAAVAVLAAAWLLLIQGHGNIGFARGCNLAARTAKGHHLIILNPDAYLQPGCISSLIAAARDFPGPCVVGARVLNEDGSEQRETDD